MTSPTSRTRLVFRSNRAVNGDGFSLDWSLGCGGVFSSPSGSFSSPGYPAGYTNSLNCNYTITTPGSDFIVANFVETFSVESGRRCQYDSVTVREAETGSTRGVYCGDEAPASVSTRGGMVVNFKTDSSIVRAGFKLSWVTHQCGGEMSEEGEIKSPVHPDTYFHNTNCTWVITAPPGQVVEIKFDFLELESGPRCRYDYVAVFDGGRINGSDLLGKYCGNLTVTPPVLKGRVQKYLLCNLVDFSIKWWVGSTKSIKLIEAIFAIHFFQFLCFPVLKICQFNEFCPLRPGWVSGVKP